MKLLKRRPFVFRRSVSGFVDSRESISCQQELLNVVIVVFVMVVRVTVVVLMVQGVPLPTKPSSSVIILLQTHSFSFLTQRTYSCSNLVAISSLVLELLKNCRVW